MPLPIYPSDSAPSSLSSVKSVIAIAAGKGGVGKSSVTVNLALAVREKGYRVGILDADLYGPSLRRMLPEDRLPAQKGKQIEPALCSGIKVISLAYFRNETEATAVRAPIANGIVTQFIQQVHWGDLDFLFVDFPPGTGDIQLTLAQRAKLQGAVMVTTPQEVAVMDVRKAVHLFDQVKVPIIGVVENMSFYRHPETKQIIHLLGKDGGKKLAREIGSPFLGEIPIDPEVCRCGDTGGSIFSNSSSETAQIFFQVADYMMDCVDKLASNSTDLLGEFELHWKEIP